MKDNKKPNNKLIQIIEYYFSEVFFENIIYYMRRSAFYLDKGQMKKLVPTVLKLGLFSTIIIIIILISSFFIFININSAQNMISDLLPNIFSEILIIFSSMFITAVLIDHYRKNAKIISDTSTSEYFYKGHDIVIQLKEFEGIDIIEPKVTDNVAFEMPIYDKTMLEVSFGDLIAHFRSSNVNSYSLPKYTLKSIAFSNKNSRHISIKLGLASFVDVWYYQYNNAPVLKSPHRERNRVDQKYFDQTLKSLLYPIVYNYYKSIFCKTNNCKNGEIIGITDIGSLLEGNTNSIILYPQIPNALGITGIVKFEYENNPYYFIQYRSKTNVDPSKVQWSYAGLVSHYADHHIVISENCINADDQSKAEKYGAYEIYEEMLPTIASILKDAEINNVDNFIIDLCRNILNNGKIFGLILNSEMLFQPELIVYHELKLEDPYAKILREKLLISIKKMASLKESGLFIIDKETAKSLCSTSVEHVEVRHIFKIICRLIKEQL